MKVYWKVDRLIVENGSRTTKSSATYGYLLWNKDNENNLILSIKCAYGILVRRELFSEIKDEKGDAYSSPLAFESATAPFFNTCVNCDIVRLLGLDGVDSVGSEDADVLLPVARFSGDGSATLPTAFNFEVGKFIELDIDLSQVSTNEYFLGLKGSSNNGILYNGSSFLIKDSLGLTASLVYANPNKLVFLRIERTSSSEFVFTVDNILIGSIINTGFNGLSLDLLGSRGDDVAFFIGTMSDINFNNELFIPLPHLGVAFDQAGNAIQTTVSKVGTDYVEGGSEWMQKYGAVRKANGDILPNNQFNQPVDPIGTPLTGLRTPLKMRLFTTGDTKQSQLIFNKDNGLYSPEVLASDNYDSGDTGLFDYTELFNSFLTEHAPIVAGKVDITDTQIKVYE